MFSNRFNTRNDPLLEAAAAAMKDGDVRRQAEAFVNEQFGVYSRKAVVREELAAYDAALEEAYGALKEGVQLDEIGDTARGQKKLARVHKRAVDRTIKATEPFFKHEKMSDSDKKTVRKNRDVADRAWERMSEELAKKDYDKDGKIESPKDEVWGSRLRAAKMAGKMEEEQIDELYGKGRLKDIKHARSKETYKAMKKAEKASDVEHDEYGYRTGPSREDKAYGAAKHREEKADMVAQKLKHHRKKMGFKEETQIDELKQSTVLSYANKVSKQKFDKKVESGHKDRYAAYTGDKESDKKSTRLSMRTNAFRNLALNKAYNDKPGKRYPEHKLRTGDVPLSHSGGSRKARVLATKEETQMDEAAYSAKSARAGKDIGKPGKQFSKIAKKAGAKYGSEERGKKVAGAILARIRAKHMKEENLEELSAFGKEFAAARAKGQSQFMSKTTGKMTTTALKSPSSSASKPTGSSAIGGVNPGISTKQAAQGTTIKQSGGFSTDAPKPSVSNYPDRGNVATGKNFAAIDKATNAAADKAATARVKAAVAGTDYAKPSKPADSHIGGKTQHWSDQGAKERAGSMASQASTVSAAGDKPSAMTGTQNVPTPPSRPASISSTSTPAPAAAPQPGAPKNDASAGVKKLMAMSESVQIGDYKYRII